MSKQIQLDTWEIVMIETLIHESIKTDAAHAIAKRALLDKLRDAPTVYSTPRRLVAK